MLLVGLHGDFVLDFRLEYRAVHVFLYAHVIFYRCRATLVDNNFQARQYAVEYGIDELALEM